MAAAEKVNKTKEPITKDQEEEMSSALIAQLLAEDNMSHGNGSYYAEYSNDSRGYDPYHSQRDRDDSYEENSEDDFDPKKKKYISKKDGKILLPSLTSCHIHLLSIVAKRGRKRKAPAATPTQPIQKLQKDKDDTEQTNQPSQEISQPLEKEPVVKPVKKPKKPVAEGFNAGVYTELEEKNFTEGLELFGRDWGKVKKKLLLYPPHPSHLVN